MNRRLPPTFSCAAFLAALFLAPLGAQVPERTFAGLTLEVPDAHLEKGEIFYLWPGEDAQVLVRSTAPEQQLAITANRIIGYVIVPFEREEAESPIAAGAFRVPAATVATATDSADGLLHSAPLLDAASHPSIGFEIVAFRDARVVESGESETVWSGTLSGRLHLKGRTHEIEAPARFTLKPFLTLAPRPPVVGDRAVLEAHLDIKPSDFGFEIPDPRRRARIAPRIAETLPVHVFLMLGNVDPEKSGNPLDNPETYAKRMRFLTLLRDLGDAASGYAFGRRLIEEHGDDAQTLNFLADTVASTEGLEYRDLSFALNAAQRAAEVSEHKNPAILDTLAEVHFKRGDIAKAVEVQSKAAQLASGRRGGAIKAKLERYRSLAPPR